MSSTSRLMEGAVVLVRNCIEQNIATALSTVSTDRNDPSVSTEAPKQYFIYPRALGLRSPSVFVIGEHMEFRKPQSGNMISAIDRINVSVLVEEKDRTRLTYKTWRYLSALHQVLDLTSLTSTDNKLKLVIKVMRAEFSEIYSNTKNEEAVDAVFRKEVYLSLDVEHYENY